MDQEAWAYFMAVRDCELASIKPVVLGRSASALTSCERRVNQRSLAPFDFSFMLAHRLGFNRRLVLSSEKLRFYTGRRVFISRGSIMSCKQARQSSPVKLCPKAGP